MAGAPGPSLTPTRCPSPSFWKQPVHLEEAPGGPASGEPAPPLGSCLPLWSGCLVGNRAQMQLWVSLSARWLHTGPLPAREDKGPGPRRAAGPCQGGKRPRQQRLHHRYPFPPASRAPGASVPPQGAVPLLTQSVCTQCVGSFCEGDFCCLPFTDLLRHRLASVWTRACLSSTWGHRPLCFVFPLLCLWPLGAFGLLLCCSDEPPVAGVWGASLRSGPPASWAHVHRLPQSWNQPILRGALGPFNGDGVGDQELGAGCACLLGSLLLGPQVAERGDACVHTAPCAYV